MRSGTPSSNAASTATCRSRTACSIVGSAPPHLGFEEGASIYNSALVFGDVEVGANTWIGPYTLLDGSGGGIEIGCWCSISTGVHIYTHDTVLLALSGGLLPQRKGAVNIGDCSYIGSQSIVAVGTRIGTRCVVAANSFVNRDMPDRTVVGGNPAQRLGRVEGDGTDVRLVFDSGKIDSWRG